MGTAYHKINFTKNYQVSEFELHAFILFSLFKSLLFFYFFTNLVIKAMNSRYWFLFLQTELVSTVRTFILFYRFCRSKGIFLFKYLLEMIFPERESNRQSLTVLNYSRVSEKNATSSFENFQFFLSDVYWILSILWFEQRMLTTYFTNLFVLIVKNFLFFTLFKFLPPNDYLSEVFSSPGNYLSS